MKTLLIVFTLGDLGGHYDSLGLYLSQMGAALDGPSTWRVQTNLTTEALKTSLSRFTHPNDKITVAELATAV